MDMFLERKNQWFGGRVKKKNPLAGTRLLEGQCLSGSAQHPVPGLSNHATHICRLTRWIGGQDEYRIKKKKEARIRFTGH